MNVGASEHKSTNVVIYLREITCIVHKIGNMLCQIATWVSANTYYVSGILYSLHYIIL